jgi:hypothetical protein
MVSTIVLIGSNFSSAWAMDPVRLPETLMPIPGLESPNLGETRFMFMFMFM